MLNKYILFTLVSSLLAASAAPTQSQSGYVELAVEWSGDYKTPYVHVEVEGTKQNLLLDTGSSDTYVNSVQVCQNATDGSCTGITATSFKFNGFEGSMKYTDGTTTFLKAGAGPIKLGNQVYNLNYSIAYGDKPTSAKFAPGFIGTELSAAKYNKPYDNIIPGLVNQGVVKVNGYGLANDKFIIGGYDSNSASEDFQTVDMIDRSFTGETIKSPDVCLDSLTLFDPCGNKTSTEIFGKSSNNTTKRFLSFDTGAGYLVVDAGHLDSLWQYLDASEYDQIPIFKLVKASNPKLNQLLTFDISGKKLSLPLSTWTMKVEGDDENVVLLIADSPKPGLNSIGSPALAKLSTIFNLDSKTISYAKAVDSNPNYVYNSAIELL